MEWINLREFKPVKHGRYFVKINNARRDVVSQQEVDHLLTYYRDPGDEILWLRESDDVVMVPSGPKSYTKIADEDFMIGDKTKKPVRFSTRELTAQKAKADNAPAASIQNIRSGGLKKKRD